jgi:hypothetical protein
MMHEIIYTEHYALIVSDEEIKEDVWFYSPSLNRVQINCNSDGCKKVIAHRPLEDAKILEGVPLLPEFEKVEDVEDLALAYSSSKGNINPEGYSDRQVGLLHGFIDGYNKSKETYNLTLTKLLDLYIEETGYGMDMWSKEENQTMSIIAKIIQSLQQPKRPKYFECETITMNKGYTDKSDYPYQECEIPKTITNSQGKTELVGSYIF